MPLTNNLTSVWEQRYEEIATFDRPMVVSSDIDLESLSTSAGSVFEIPQGALRSIDEPDEFIWTSDDGRRTPISKLDDNHLTNIIKMLSRTMVGIDEESRQYQRNDSTLKLMREERDKRNADRST